MINYKSWIKRGLVASRLLSLTRWLKSPRTVILRYHSVNATPDNYRNSIGRGITHAAAAFTQHMEWLARTYEPVSLDDVGAAVVGRRPMPKCGVLITFDDGYADNCEVAMRVLNRLGLKGAFYVTVDCVEPHKMPWFCRLRHAFAVTTRETWQDPGTGHFWRLTDPVKRRRAYLRACEECARQSCGPQDELVGRIERSLAAEPLAPTERLMLDWEQIRELHSQGHVVGSHTLSHPNLAHVGRDDLARELRESRRKLEEKLGARVSHFSYPSPILEPHWSAGTVACCAEAGYETAVTCNAGPVLAGDSPLCLKRIAVPEEMNGFKWAVERAFLGHRA